MKDYIRTNAKYLQYWLYTFTIIFVFGSGIGYLGMVRLHNLPGLVVIDPAVQGQLKKLDNIDSRITSLDTRITILEHHVDTSKLVAPKHK